MSSMLSLLTPDVARFCAELRLWHDSHLACNLKIKFVPAPPKLLGYCLLIPVGSGQEDTAGVETNLPADVSAAYLTCL